MKKLVALFLLISTCVYALNFSGRQTLNGLGATVLFKAPASGIYFINGVLSLPQPSMNGGTGQSRVIASITRTGFVTLYTGPTGANGFTIPAVTLATNDAVTVTLSSSASEDQKLNAVRGDVFFGNKF